MRTPVLLTVSLAGFGFALWLARGGDPPSPPPRDAPSASSLAAPRGPATIATHTAARSAQASARPPVGKLDPRGDRFRNRVDEQIPARLYGVASRCYKGGLERDQRLDLTYRIRVREGNVTIGDIKVVDSTINDGALERCIKDKLVQQSWRDEELPDMDEEDDLYMRAAGWQSYLANAADDDSIGG
jgi:hypothetical protein